MSVLELGAIYENIPFVWNTLRLFGENIFELVEYGEDISWHGDCDNVIDLVPVEVKPKILLFLLVDGDAILFFDIPQ